jgi:hypothetical protein
MVQNKLHWLNVLGLLAASPLAAFGQTGDPTASKPIRLATGSSVWLADQTGLAIPVGYQEQQPSTNDTEANTSKNNSIIDRSVPTNPEPKVDRDEQENPLADSFPATNLRGGINDNSLQRAIAKREITDPNMEFLAAAALAPIEYQCQAPQVWKTWDSPNVRYRPLYFEDENLERYGNGVGYVLQPYKSGLHFISRVVTLPYHIAAEGTRDCEYGLGYFRPGNCNPAYRQQFELSKRGAVAQALTLGLILGL